VHTLQVQEHFLWALSRPRDSLKPDAGKADGDKGDDQQKGAKGMPMPVKGAPEDDIHTSRCVPNAGPQGWKEAGVGHYQHTPSSCRTVELWVLKFR
jgi:hypothetical protein